MATCFQKLGPTENQMAETWGHPEPLSHPVSWLSDISASLLAESKGGTLVPPHRGRESFLPLERLGFRHSINQLSGSLTLLLGTLWGRPGTLVQTDGTNTVSRLPLEFEGKFCCFFNNRSSRGFSAPMICPAKI